LRVKLMHQPVYSKLIFEISEINLPVLEFWVEKKIAHDIDKMYSHLFVGLSFFMFPFSCVSFITVIYNNILHIVKVTWIYISQLELYFCCWHNAKEVGTVFIIQNFYGCILVEYVIELNILSIMLSWF
jgi:hypothetical protein